ncbi:hypothetical protein [Kitasatospora sp. McL0602]|uniref:hypothetical protein n=1 Tax=Kitasatospora sp. McL0602 TaxID=3439530 RepID=UPI003F892E30
MRPEVSRALPFAVMAGAGLASLMSPTLLAGLGTDGPLEHALFGSALLLGGLLCTVGSLRRDELWCFVGLPLLVTGYAAYAVASAGNGFWGPFLAYLAVVAWLGSKFLRLRRAVNDHRKETRRGA